MDEAESLDQIVASRVKDLRAARGLTLDQLAALSGVSRAMISRIERAEASATAVLLVKLGAALGVTLGDLFETPQPATDPGSQAARLDAVEVRAQKRVQTLDEVPISMQLLDGTDLSEQGIKDTSQLGGQAVNVKITQNTA